MSHHRPNCIPVLLRLVLFYIFSAILYIPGNGQMRQIFANPPEDVGTVRNMHFYSGSEGYVAFEHAIGFTSDSGRTFDFRYVRQNNVDYNFNNVDLLGGFTIRGVKAYNRNLVLVYGNYGWAPCILQSLNGGISFKLVLKSPFPEIGEDKGGINDMVILKESGVTIAIDVDRMYRSTNQGANWTTIANEPGAGFLSLDGYENGHVYAWNYTGRQSHLWQTGINGMGLTKINLPAPIRFASFYNANEGYLCVNGTNGPELLFTRNGGLNTYQVYHPNAPRIPINRMKFLNAATGYAIAGRNDTYRTIDSGRTWEKIPRSNGMDPVMEVQVTAITNFGEQQLWTGGANSMIELNTSLGGATIPSAAFSIDTNGLSVSGEIALISWSLPELNHKWFINGVFAGDRSTIRHRPEAGRTTDTIRLEVTRGGPVGSLERYQEYNLPPPPVVPVPPVISDAFPLRVPAGSNVKIYGAFFGNLQSVSFGGVPAAAFSVFDNNTLIVATVGAGADGDIEIITADGSVKISGFSIIKPPVITGFSPVSAAYRQTVVISGKNLTGTSSLTFGNTAPESYQVVNDSTITAVMDHGESGDVKLITVAGQDSMPGFTFNHTPFVYRVTPERGYAGTVMTVVGKGFNQSVQVTIGTDTLPFTVISDSVITVIIRDGNDGFVRVSNNYGFSESGPGFRYPALPTIESFSPTVGGDGTRVLVKGMFFADKIERITVGGVPLKDVYFDYFVGYRLTIGAGASGPIVFHTGDSSVASKQLFEYVQKPVLKSYTPASGKTGTVVTLTGKNFHNTSQVFFGGAMASDLKILSDSVLTAVVSSGTSGNVELQTAGGKISLPGFIYYTSAKPAILGIAPLSGPAGTSVAITGNNFGNDPAVVHVRFGAAYGKVISTEPSKITVTAPAGASFDLLEITVNGFVVRSRQAFSLQSQNKAALTDTSFHHVRKLFPPGGFDRFVKFADIDGDGLVDLLYNNTGTGYHIMLNTSSGDSLSFSAPFTAPELSGIWEPVIADIDGDGKPDISGTTGQTTVVLRNESRIGKPAFSIRTVFNGWKEVFKAADFNGDAKTDLVQVDLNRFLFLHNVSSGSSIDLKWAGPTFTSGNILVEERIRQEPELTDLDNDGLPELIFRKIINGFPGTSLIIHKNITLGDTVAFDQPQTFYGGPAPGKIMFGDFNHDDKTDFVVHNTTGLEYIQNTSIGGLMKFAPPVRIVTDEDITNFDIADLNGDGLPDIVWNGFQDSSFTIAENRSQNGLVNFALPQPLLRLKYKTNQVLVHDLNNNGNPELISRDADGSLSLYSADKVPPPADTCSIQVSIIRSRDSLCSGNQLVFTATANAINPTWLWLLNNRSTGITGNIFRSSLIKSNDQVSVIVIAGTSCGQKRDTSSTMSVGTVTDHRFSITVAPSPSAMQGCDTTAPRIVAGTLVFNGNAAVGHNASYRWLRNGVVVGNSMPDLLVTNARTGDQVWLEAIVATVCKTDTITSNRITINVTPRTLPVLSFSGPAELIAGETVTIRAHVQNPGRQMSYAWYDSTRAHDWRLLSYASGPELRYVPVLSGDHLRCVVISTDSCGRRDTVDGKLKLVLKDQPVTLANLPARAYPNPVTSTLFLDNINLADNWQSLSVIGHDGQQHLILPDIRNRTTVRISLVSLPKGVYFIQLKRITGENTYLKIIKI